MSLGEILIIMLFILLFFGSESIPNIARTLGRGMRQFRDATSEIKNEIKKSADKVVEETKLKSLSLNEEENKTPENDTKKNVRLDQQFEEDEA